MAGETITDPLISTKLHRPPVDRNHVHRPHLLERLDQRRRRPSTLVSAPAGYGKSFLISCWLELCDIPSAWLSLDENDNDLRKFTAYFIAAVETIFPGVCRNTQALLNASDLPPVAALATGAISTTSCLSRRLTLNMCWNIFSLRSSRNNHRKPNNILWGPPSWIASAARYARQEFRPPKNDFILPTEAG